MPTDSEVHNQTLQTLQTQNGEDLPFSKFTWKGNDYSCVFQVVEQTFIDQGGGVVLDMLTLQVFENMPVPGVRKHDEIIFPATSSLDLNLDVPQKAWRVETITHASQANPKIVCYAKTRGN
jgi:hypothetical protein